MYPAGGKKKFHASAEMKLSSAVEHWQFHVPFSKCSHRVAESIGQSRGGPSSSIQSLSIKDWNFPKYFVPMSVCFGTYARPSDRNRQ